MATAGSGKLIKVWNVNTGEIIDILQGHKKGANSLVFVLDGSFLLSAGVEGKIKIWDMTYIKYEKCIKEKLFSYAYLLKPKDEFETTDQYNKRLDDFLKLKSTLKEDCIKDHLAESLPLGAKAYPFKPQSILECQYRFFHGFHSF